MPTEDENIQYLYLVLTNAGPPQIDWPPICAALTLSQGAASKRWSRLKTAIEGGKAPPAGSYQFLWLLVKHSGRDKALDWKAISAKCGTTPGAASKRYSRMKVAFEKEDGAPATPKKNGGGGAPSSAAKRKRTSTTTTTPAKKSARGADAGFKPTHDDDDDDEEKEYVRSQRPRRRAKAGESPSLAPRNTFPTPAQSSFNVTEATTLIKTEAESAPGFDVFFDAEEQHESEEEEEAFQQDRLEEWLLDLGK